MIDGGLSTPFIKRPIATSLMMAGILFVGLVAYPRLPVAPLPQIDFPTISVSASFPGASPEIMASSVAQPLETQFTQIAGVSELTSTSSVGSTSITIQFDLNRNIDGAANDVMAAINAATGQLPKSLPNPPTFRKVNPADSPILILSATSDSMPLPDLDENVETKISQQISQLPGVGSVTIGGQQKPAIRIQLDPARLVTKGLSLEDVRTQLALTTNNSPKGAIEGEIRSYTLYDNGQLTVADKWNDVILAYRNGAPLRIRDVGIAIAGPEDIRKAAWTDGTRGIFLVVYKQPGANVIDTVDRIKAELPRLELALPPSIKVGIMGDRTRTIRASVADVQLTLALSVVLVVLVIFVFLRSFWATIIPSVTVPLALLGTYGWMWLVGYTLDNLSLMALTISVGFVVDDAIVMLENITRYIEEGDSPLHAAIKGAREIGFTIFSISLSLIAALIPLLLMGGIIGRLFREFAVVLSITIVVSAFVSLTLTPMMASRFLRAGGAEQHGTLFGASERVFKAMLDGYSRSLDVALRFRFVTLCLFFASLAVTLYLFVVIPKGFFPQQDNGLISGVSEAAQDISYKGMLIKQQQLGAIVQADPAVASVAMLIGGNGGNSINTGLMFITLVPRDERDINADQVIARLRPKLETVEGARLYLQAAQDVRVGGRSARTQYQMTLQDADVSELSAWAPKILDKLRTLKGLRDVATDRQVQGTTLTLVIDRDQASRFGLQPQLIDDTLYDAFGQRQVAQYFTQTNTYHVIMEVMPQQQGDIETLDKIYLKSSVTGQNVPLSNVVRWSTLPVEPLSIAHQGQFPAVTLSFNLAQGVALGEATQAIEQATESLRVPGSLLMHFQGTAQVFQDTLNAMPLLILAALVVVYLVLGMLYESYIHPLTIISTLPSAALGAFAALMLGGYDFNLIGLIGIILLIGIVKKNGIMMVDFAIARERDCGVSSEDSIRHAATLRFRPIMMTTMAALLGALPLMLGQGTGSELRQPLGWSMVGGLIVSQALTLFTTPAVYLYLAKLSQWTNSSQQTNTESHEPVSSASLPRPAPGVLPTSNSADARGPIDRMSATPN